MSQGAAKGGGQSDGVPPLPALGEIGEFLRLIWALDHGLQITSRATSRSCGLSGPQRLVVRIVGRFPGISAGQLAQILHLDPSSLTSTLKRLVEGGLVERRTDPRDARRLLLGLTEQGRLLDVPTPNTVEDAVSRVLASSSSETVRAAKEVLAALNRELAANAK